MIEKFLNKLIKENINIINPIDMISENVLKIRKDLKEFFSLLEKWTAIMKNLGRIIQTEHDRNNFVIYDEIMEIVIFYYL